MNRYSKTIFIRLIGISKYLFFLFFLFLITGAITGTGWLGLAALLLLLISWVMPGVFLIFRVPWFAFAWLHGVNPIIFPKTDWEQLPRGKKTLVYFTSVMFFIFAIGAIMFYSGPYIP